MSTARLAPLPASFRETTEALHRLAVYVISPAQRLVNGEIIMRATSGGFATFEFDGRAVGVQGDRLLAGGQPHPISSLNAAAEVVGIAPDVDQQTQFDVPAHGDLDADLGVDAEAALALADWYAFATEALEALRSAAHSEDDASIVRIWPEHFDAAIDMGDAAAGRRATYGASPGDRHHDQPYLYVSPWAGRIDEFFGDPSFKGASLVYSQLQPQPDQLGAALDFLREARRRVLAHTA